MSSWSDPLARLMLVPDVVGALRNAEGLVDSVQLTARRRADSARPDALAAMANAIAALDESDITVAALVLAESDLIGVRTSLLQGIARLHVIAGAAQPLVERGRPREDFAQSDRLLALAELVAQSQAPALLVASIAHGELAVMKPFQTGNGVIALTVWRRIMVEAGLDPVGMVMSPVGLRDLGANSYKAALSAYQDGGSDGVIAWVKHCARAVELGVDALQQLLNQQR